MRKACVGELSENILGRLIQNPSWILGQASFHSDCVVQKTFSPDSVMTAVRQGHSDMKSSFWNPGGSQKEEKDNDMAESNQQHSDPPASPSNRPQNISTMLTEQLTMGHYY
jgi:hypothetical protein